MRLDFPGLFRAAKADGSDLQGLSQTRQISALGASRAEFRRHQGNAGLSIVSHSVIEAQQNLTVDDVERMKVGAFQNDIRCHSRRKRFFPAQRAQTPLISGFQAGKSPLRNRRTQVIASAGTEVEKFFRHDRADNVGADILLVGPATAIAEKPGEGPERTGNQWLAKDVFCRWSGCSRHWIV
jgi:hypothetical protein